MNAPPSQLSIIRLALLAGVLGFGGITWFLHQQGNLSVMPPESAAVLTMLAMVVTGAALLAILAIRLVVLQGVATQKSGTMTIVAWAIGETPALLGAVHYFMTGEPRWFLVGLSVMLVAFMAMPVPRSA